MDADVIVVGAGLAGLVAAAELADAGKRVVLVEQEPEASLGGQAFWSFGGLFMVDTPEQRRLGIRDSHELAWQDWLGQRRLRPRRGPLAAALGRGVRRLRARARSAPGCASRGVAIFPIVGWAERGGGTARRARQLRAALPPHLGHRARRRRAVRAPRARGGRRAASSRCGSGIASTSCVTTDGAVAGVRGAVLEPSAVGAWRGELARRRRRVRALGAGGDRHVGRHRRRPRPRARELAGAARRLRRRTWSPACPRTSTGGCSAITEAAGAQRHQPRPHVALRRGHPELEPGLARPRHPDPARPVVALARRRGKRLPAPLFPGFDTLGTLAHIMRTGYEHSWFVLTQRIIEKEFALSGSEQNPDLTGKSMRQVLGRARGRGARRRSRRSSRTARTSSSRDTLPELVARHERARRASR